MALADVSIKSPGGNNLPSAWTFPTKAGGTNIKAGEPVKFGSSSTATYVIPAADSEPTTAAPILGIATSTSTETSSVDGTVDVQLPTAGLVFACKAKTASDINTAAKLQTFIGTSTLFDLTSSTYTVDTGVTGASDGLFVVGGDVTNSIVYFTIRPTTLQQN